MPSAALDSLVRGDAASAAAELARVLEKSAAVPGLEALQSGVGRAAGWVGDQLKNPQVANPVYGALAGAGIGGVAGLMNPNKKRPLRGALQGALMGGLGGVAYNALTNRPPGEKPPTPAAVQSANRKMTAAESARERAATADPWAAAKSEYGDPAVNWVNGLIGRKPAPDFHAMDPKVLAGMSGQLAGGAGGAVRGGSLGDSVLGGSLAGPAHAAGIEGPLRAALAEKATPPARGTDTPSLPIQMADAAVEGAKNNLRAGDATVPIGAAAWHLGAEGRRTGNAKVRAFIEGARNGGPEAGNANLFRADPDAPEPPAAAGAKAKGKAGPQKTPAAKRLEFQASNLGRRLSYITNPARQTLGDYLPKFSRPEVDPSPATQRQRIAEGDPKWRTRPVEGPAGLRVGPNSRARATLRAGLREHPDLQTYIDPERVRAIRGSDRGLIPGGSFGRGVARTGALVAADVAARNLAPEWMDAYDRALAHPIDAAGNLWNSATAPGAPPQPAPGPDVAEAVRLLQQLNRGGAR